MGYDVAVGNGLWQVQQLALPLAMAALTSQLQSKGDSIIQSAICATLELGHTDHS